MVYVCMRACVRACVRSCVRACVRVCVVGLGAGELEGMEVWLGSNRTIFVFVY